MLSLNKLEGKKNLFLRPQESQRGSIFHHATVMIKPMGQKLLLRPLINFSPYKF